MVRVPVRVGPGFESKLKTTFVLPVPPWFAAPRCNHEAFVEAVQLPVVGRTASTTLSLPAAGASKSELAPSVYVLARTEPALSSVQITRRAARRDWYCVGRKLRREGEKVALII